MASLEAKLEATEHLLASKAAATALAAAQKGLEKDIGAARERMAQIESDFQTKLASWRQRPVVTREDLLGELDAYAADRVGLPDYAMAAGGAAVVAHSALQPRACIGHGASGIGSLLTLKAWNPLNLAYCAGWATHPKANEWLLTPGTEVPGNCLPLRMPPPNATWRPFVDVQLRERIAVDAVSLEHLPPRLAFHFETAPRVFAVSGWLTDATATDEEDAGAGKDGAAQPVGMLSSWLNAMLGGSAVDPASAVDAAGHPVLGRWSYDRNGRAAQTFKVARPRVADRVRLTVESAQGDNAPYACIYRFRVHGKPAP